MILQFHSVSTAVCLLKVKSYLIYMFSGDKSQEENSRELMITDRFDPVKSDLHPLLKDRNLFR